MIKQYITLQTVTKQWRSAGVQTGNVYLFTGLPRQALSDIPDRSASGAGTGWAAVPPPPERENCVVVLERERER